MFLLSLLVPKFPVAFSAFCIYFPKWNYIVALIVFIRWYFSFVLFYVMWRAAERHSTDSSTDPFRQHQKLKLVTPTQASLCTKDNSCPPWKTLSGQVCTWTQNGSTIHINPSPFPKLNFIPNGQTFNSESLNWPVHVKQFFFFWLLFWLFVSK